MDELDKKLVDILLGYPSRNYDCRRDPIVLELRKLIDERVTAALDGMKHWTFPNGTMVDMTNAEDVLNSLIPVEIHQEQLTKVTMDLCSPLKCGHPKANLNVLGGKGRSARSDVHCRACVELGEAVTAARQDEWDTIYSWSDIGGSDIGGSD